VTAAGTRKFGQQESSIPARHDHKLVFVSSGLTDNHSLFCSQTESNDPLSEGDARDSGATPGVAWGEARGWADRYRDRDRLRITQADDAVLQALAGHLALRKITVAPCTHLPLPL
jgi:hypothetical protein